MVRRAWRLLGAGAGAWLLGAVLPLGSCAHEGSEPEPGAGGRPAAEAAPAHLPRSAPPQPVDPARTGTLAVTVLWAGEPPPRASLAADREPACGHATPPLSEDALVVDGRVQNAFVTLGTSADGWEAPPPGPEVATLDQAGCLYVPHALALQVGTLLRVKNSDPLNHNVRVVAKRNQALNRNQPPGAEVLELAFAERESVAFRCDLHPWMAAWVYVEAHPWFDLTGADGVARLGGIPEGRFTLEARHERFGRLRREVVVRAGEELEVELRFEP